MNELSFPPPDGRGGDFPYSQLNNLPKQPSERREDKASSMPVFEKWLLALCVVACVMAILALQNLITETGPVARLKAALIGVGAGGVSFAVSMIGIRKGAYFAAIGYWSAGVASVLSILLVGGALWASTLSGLILSDVGQLELLNHAEMQSQVIAARTEELRTKEKQTAAVLFVVADVRERTRCEEEVSCISLKAKGGRGEVTRQLEPVSKRGEAILAVLAKGEEKGLAALAAANVSAKAFQDTIGKTDGDVWTRRGEAQLIDARLRQQLNDINDAYPEAAVAAFTSELAQGISFEGLPEATARMSTLLAGHSDRIRAAQSQMGVRALLPSFPSRPGVTTALRYIGHFLPLAAIILAIECVLPILVWLCACLAIHWDLERKLGRRRPPNDLDGGASPAAIRLHSTAPPEHRDLPLFVKRIGEQ